MRSELLALLQCPACGSPDGLRLDATTDDAHETREGQLHCRSCGLERPVRDGVADLMLDPSPEVSAEAEGLKRFALRMREDGWDRARVLSLPHDESGYWWAQRRAMERLLETVPFVPGQSILDVGPTPAGPRPPSPGSVCARWRWTSRWSRCRAFAPPTGGLRSRGRPSIGAPPSRAIALATTRRRRDRS